MKTMIMTIEYDEYDDEESDILAKVRQMMVPARGMGGWEKRLWMNAIIIIIITIITVIIITTTFIIIIIIIITITTIISN